ncbi:hypothetical protein PWT90_01410 [Aphanocladium album]|nr:hypothetical protein PWT90_01410 [Aphanocladium album]
MPVDAVIPAARVCSQVGPARDHGFLDGRNLVLTVQRREFTLSRDEKPPGRLVRDGPVYDANVPLRRVLPHRALAVWTARRLGRRARDVGQAREEAFAVHHVRAAHAHDAVQRLRGEEVRALEDDDAAQVNVHLGSRHTSARQASPHGSGVTQGTGHRHRLHDHDLAADQCGLLRRVASHAVLDVTARNLNAVQRYEALAAVLHFALTICLGDTNSSAIREQWRFGSQQGE